MGLKLGKKGWLKWLGFLLLIPSLVVNYFLYQQNQFLRPGIKVIEVLDGDTLLLENKVRVRLRHVDAPELDYCGGQEAKDELIKLVKDKKVVLQEQIIDQQGRPMALVYLDHLLVNQQMMKSGWVRYHSDKTDQTKVLKAEADKAKQEQKGIFSSQCYQKENLAKPGCLIKGNIDKNKYTDNKKYYFPGCAQYQFTIVEKDLGEDWFCSEDEAVAAGFVKSKTCYDKVYQPAK